MKFYLFTACVDYFMTETTFPPPPPPVRGRKRSPSFFWLGFALGFALLALAGCGGLAMALGLTDLSLAELQGVGAAWTPPTLTTPAPEAQGVTAASSANTQDGAFQAGDIVRNITSSRVNIRMTPGHLGKPAGDIILQIEPGASIKIVGEHTAQDNLTWWRVNVNGLDGWVAEATASGVQILAK